MASIRYFVSDVDVAIAFYTEKFGFKLKQKMSPAFAYVSKDDLTLWLSGPQSSAARPMPDGRRPAADGWNRLVIEVKDLPARVAQMKQAGVHFRAGKGLQFIVNVWGTFLHRGQTHRNSTQEQFNVNQGTWVETLQQLGYAQMALLEIPVPDARMSPNLAEAFAHLSKAQEAFMRGEYREAVGCCRDVVEALSVATGDKEAKDPANARELDKEGRLRRVRQALFHLCSLARHSDDLAKQTEWKRRDSIAIISMVAALMRQLSVKRQSPS